MRLLHLTLSLLLAASSSLGAPAVADDSAPQTTIETIYETVTRTVIHEVTEPTVAKPCACKDDVEGSGLTEEDTVPVQDTVVETPEEVADSGANYPVAASDSVNSVPAVSTVEVEQKDEKVKTRMCTCEESAACRKASSVNDCMKECEADIKDYGEKTDDSYLGCFQKNNVSIIEAENCLFEDITCNNETAAKYLEEPTKWDSLSDITYAGNADKLIKETYQWKNNEAKYDKVQKFFHCTKHCMHKKVQECSANKECTLQLPARDAFATKMNSCTKKNPKIAQSIFSACQCLAWQKGVTSLRGSCVVIGNQYYIDKA